MAKVGALLEIGRAFGIRDGMLRLGYELQRGSGLMSRRLRAAAGWERWQLQRIAPGVGPSDLLQSRRNGIPPFFFSDVRAIAPGLRSMMGSEGAGCILAEANRILEGKLPYFGSLVFECGLPPNWFRNPTTGEQVFPQRSWTTMRFASPDYGDLKFILEPSRFLFAYTLARAYALSGDERFPEAFWRALEDWTRHNPPMEGPLWICGQESSLRIVAWSFALRAFIHSPATTPERCSLLLSAIAAHAWRTEQTLDYARSQRSNHLISEAVGLWTAGALYPELARSAEWRAVGARLLREAVLDQFTPEGVYLQRSFNYQRMALQLLLWTLHLAKLQGVALPAEITERTAAGLEFLRAVVDPVSGRAPNHGANDGSLVLPLSSCDYGDFRPLLQLGATVLDRPSLFQPGPWDETSLWVCGRAPATGPHSPSPPLPASTGYHRLGDPNGGQNSWALVHASHYTRRPFQADQLHVDLWWRGLNLARDAGTYLYNGAPPWDNGFSRSVVHNTVTVDGQDQMRRAGRFLWVDWAQASAHSSHDHFEGEHDGYRRLGVTHRRAVQFLGEAGWVIVDDLLGAGRHEARLHWLLADLPLYVVSDSPFQAQQMANGTHMQWSIFSSSEGKASIVREGKSPKAAGTDTRLLGWYSPTYGQLSPAVSLLCSVQGELPIRLVTIVLTDGSSQVSRANDVVIIQREGLQLHQVSLVPKRDAV